MPHGLIGKAYFNNLMILHRTRNRYHDNFNFKGLYKATPFDVNAFKDYF